MRFLALVALRCLCGTAPVTRRSGKSMIVVRRLAAHNRLRDAVYHWARVAVQRDPTSRAKYAPPSVPAATAMPVPCDPSPTGSSPSPVPCSKTRPPSIPNTQGNAMPRSRYPGHRAAGTIAAKLHLQMVGSPPPQGRGRKTVDARDAVAWALSLAAASRPSAVVGAPALGPSCYGIPAPARAPRRNAATRAVLLGKKVLG